MARHNFQFINHAISASTMALLAATTLTACQSSSGGGKTAAAPAVSSPPQQTAAASADTLEAPKAVDPQAEPVMVSDSTNGEKTSELAMAAQPPASPAVAAACAIALPSGPPPKPAKGADFGSAVVKNTGKSVQRGIIQNIAGRFGGGLGAAVGGAVANSTIRNEEDIKGVWKITDGRPNCACEVSVDSLFKLEGRGGDTGTSLKRGCTNPQLNRVATWALGHSFTGYGAKFELKAADKQTVLATMSRDGIHYFSGTLSDGTPVVMWRDKQNYMELNAFKKTAN